MSKIALVWFETAPATRPADAKPRLGDLPDHLAQNLG
jgi:hypothetical protein